MDADTQLRLGIILFIAYTALLVVGASTTAARLVRFRRAGLPPPRLLGRDLVLVGGHAISLLFITGARVLVASNVISGNLAGQPWWWVVTSGPPLVAIATYVYFELFVIR